MSNEHLVKQFKNVGLKLELSDRSIIAGLRGGEGIVQIDIAKKGREEVFRLFPGDDKNRLQVVGTDKEMRGNPHTADELVVLIGVSRDRKVFVRGSVRHSDHDPVKFPSWRKVIRNTEEIQPNGAAPGVGWVD